VKQVENIFANVFFENVLKGFKATNLTTSSIIILLQELTLYAKKNVLASIENQEEAFDFYNKGQEHDHSVYTYFPECLGDDNVPGFEKENIRYQKESELKTSSYNGVVCVGTPTSFRENIIPRHYRKDIKQLDLAVNLKLKRETLVDFLENLRYERVEIVENPSEYNFRGDVLDFFPPLFKNPVRVSFCFDTIENLHVFDPENQQPRNSLKKIKIREAPDKETVDNINLIDHADPFLLFICDLNKGELILSGSHCKENISFSSVSIGREFDYKNKSSVSAFLKNFNRIYYISKGGKTPNFLEGYSFNVIYGSIEKGFWSKNQKTLVLSENDFFDVYTQSRRWQPKQSKTALEITVKNLSSLKNGDLVVHESFGVGLYRGPIEKSFKIGVREGVELEYKNNTILFVSMDQLSFIHRYVGSGRRPSLSVLGSKKWQNEVKKAKESAREVVYEIFSLYSKKSTKRSFNYDKENDLDGVLSSSFSFVETPDQKKAFKDVFEDMNGEEPMDRLVSGDVGFGKTEVAIRAIFKAFLSNKVSVLLCPTTILADQHFITCKERLAQFGVSISLLSRFKTKREQLKTLSLVEKGQVDVLIGTHRLLSKDVQISNLGLLVIDEEHRFGVSHKEKIRSFKNNVDVLTLTATPIPRTLQQALVGLKNLTTIKTPPISRKPINTFVKYFSWPLIFSHIQKEINRKGQVYFLYNDIKSIPFVVKKIKDRFPKKAIVGASGKMDSKNLEDVVLAFFSGFIDVLVCTTIIESGLDVTNANTIIIHNAQNFGLAQLYQIRGRVGRGKRQASCLLLIPHGKKLENDSYNRLKAIEQNTALGSGHAISQKDLEIRGSGSLFGYKQSGHISAVGFEMYCDLLREEISVKKNQKKGKSKPVLIMNTKTEIPNTYIKKEQIRIDYYYQLSKAEKQRDIEKIIKNLEAGFGVLPEETKTLANTAHLRILLTGSIIKKIEGFNNKVVLFFKKPEPNFDIVSFFQRVESFKHKNLVNYKYENNDKSGLKMYFETFNFFPSLKLLFSFVKTVKEFL
tara:strand:+ start:3171 stop:6260 length:3090 start_codon:yes stop_codon:yes gene_type:complete